MILHFAEFQYDVLKEVGNIGAGNAATALAKMLDKQVDMLVPNVDLLPFEDIAEKLGGAEEIMVAVFLRVEGDISGNLYFIIRQESAKLLLHSMMGISVSDDVQYSDMEISALCEIGNILAGSYLSSLADLTKLAMHPTVPSIAIDMLGAVLSYGLLHYGAMGDHALLIDTSFFQNQQQFEGHFLLIPDPDCFTTLFAALGVPE